MAISVELIIVVLTVCAVIAIYACIVASRIKSVNQALSTELSAQQGTCDKLTIQLQNLAHQLEEYQASNFGMVSKIKQLEAAIETIQLAQQQLTEQQPEHRYYSKGVKLATQGASVQELMAECDMPQAEAELLFNLHNNQK